jgi:hypothetical protein
MLSLHTAILHDLATRQALNRNMHRCAGDARNSMAPLVWGLSHPREGGYLHLRFACYEGIGMTGTLDPLVLDLVEWVAKEPRAYAEVMDAWRTSCPRLTVWEDATDHGYVERRPVTGQGVLVFVTDAGRALLRAEGRG